MLPRIDRVVVSGAVATADGPRTVETSSWLLGDDEQVLVIAPRTTTRRSAGPALASGAGARAATADARAARARPGDDGRP